MLGGLALKRRWQKRRAADGKPADKPNLVMGINVQVCWEKFANYWDVSATRSDGGRPLPPLRRGAVKVCDENTIGSSQSWALPSTAHTSPSGDLHSSANSRPRPIDIPVHVDGASGAFIAPFLDRDLQWDWLPG